MTKTPPEGGLQTEWPTEPAGARAPRKHPLSFFRELPVLVVVAIGLALLMKTFLIQAFFIPSGSMEPTLHGRPETGENDRVLVNRLVYRFREPRRGEVVVFIHERPPENVNRLQRIWRFLKEGLGAAPPGDVDFIKRVIGLPGDRVEVTRQGVFITPLRGKRFKLSEPYIKRTSDSATTDASTCGDATECAQGPEGIFPQNASKRVPEDQYFVMGDNRGNSSDGRAFGPIRRTDIVGKAFVKIWPIPRAGRIGSPTYCADPRARCPNRSAVGPDGAALPRAAPLLPPPTVALALGALRRRRAA